MIRFKTFRYDCDPLDDGVALRPGRALARRFDSQGGFAVVSVLLLLVAIGALAVGAFFLTITNLRLAENSRAQATARYNAEKGLDIALMVIADRFVAEGGTLPPLNLDGGDAVGASDLSNYMIDSDDYEITRYSVSGTVAEVQVTGFARRGSDDAAPARHPVAARFVGVFGASGGGGGPGFVTPESIEVSGQSVLLLNMHAGGRLRVTGDATASPLFTYWSGSGQCRLQDDGVECQTDQDSPEVDAVDWDAQYAALNSKYCDGVNPVAGPFVNVTDPNEVVCLPDSGSFTITGGPLQNVTIVGGKDTVVTLDTGSEFTSEQRDNDEGVEDPDEWWESDAFALKMIAGDIRLTANNTLTDRNRIVAHGNVVLAQEVTALTDGQCLDGDDLRDCEIVQTRIEAGNNVVFQGAGTRPIYAEIVANDKFCRIGSGGAVFVGSVIAGAGEPNGTQFGQNEDCRANMAAIDISGRTNARLPDGFDTGGPGADEPLGILLTMRRP